MANWTKQSPKGSTKRRKWNLEDRSSLNNLKYHFAADGCSDFQYDLAKQLLDINAETSSHEQGVYWLLRAAQQGHEDALQLLQECYNQKRGVTESNEYQVKDCLSMSSAERAARKAARELFACLSNGSEYITPVQLEKKMREIYNIQKNKRQQKLVEDNNKCEVKDDNRTYSTCSAFQENDYLLKENYITEDALITAAVSYSRGRLPSISRTLSLSIPPPNSLDQFPCFLRFIFHPVLFLTLIYHRFVNCITELPTVFSSNMKILFSLIAYVLVSTENLEIILPMFAYYLSLFMMICSTFKMVRTKHEFVNFRIWSGLFLSYGEYVDVGQSENQFVRNNLRPYLHFFTAFVINIITYPIIKNEWMPHSEITVFSFILVFLTLGVFMYTSPRNSIDVLILFSFGVNVLAKYPYEMDPVVITGWRFLDLKFPTFCSFVIGNGIEFCLNCRTVLYLIIPVFLVQLAQRSNWRGIYTHLFPHCVTLSWLQICVLSSQYATMFGLTRTVLAVAGILLFLPLFGIVILMLPIFLAIEWLGLTDPKIRIFTYILAATFALLGLCLMAMDRRTQKYVTILQISFGLIAAVLLIVPYMTTNFSKIHSDSSYDNSLRRNSILKSTGSSEYYLPWEFFYQYCHHPSWENVNKVKAQIRCSQLEGSLVSWEGTVTSIQITDVSNFPDRFIKTCLPSWLGNYLTCSYGNYNNFECDGFDQCEEINKMFKVKQKCNLNKWNSYVYEIKVRINSGILSRPSDVYLKGDNSFGNFTQGLVASDRVWFKGRLSNKRRISNIHEEMTLGVGKPVVDLIAIGCTTCSNKELTSVIIKDKEHFLISARVQDLMCGIKYFLNVVFNPLIVFK